MHIESLGETLRGLRQLRGLSQRQLGERLGVTQAHISQIEAGSYTPSLGVLESYLAELDAHLTIELNEGGFHNDGSGPDATPASKARSGQET